MGEISDGKREQHSYFTVKVHKKIKSMKAKILVMLKVSDGITAWNLNSCRSYSPG